MRIVLIYIVLFGFISIAWRFRDTWWGNELFRFYGVHPSGPFGSYTRKDYFKRAVGAALIAGLCFLLSLTGFWFAERQTLNSRTEQIAMAYFFMFILLAAMAAAISLGTLWNSFFARRVPHLPYAVILFGVLAGFSDLAKTADGFLSGAIEPWHTRAARRILNALRANPSSLSAEDIVILNREMESIPLSQPSIRIPETPGAPLELTVFPETAS